MQQTADKKQKLKRACKIKADEDISDGIRKYKQRIEYCNCYFKIYCPFKIQNLVSTYYS